jgi:hypothetical protein
MRIRQIALVARELEPMAETLCACLDLEVCHRDPGVATFGLENVLIPIGDTFLEVVSPVEDKTTAGRLLERRDGDGGYMVILQTQDLDAERKRMQELGVRIVWEITLDDIASIHLHPRDVGGAILSLDVSEPAGAWRWAGPDWESSVRTDTTEKIVGVELQAADPGAMARRWAEVVGQPLVDAGDAGYEIPLDEGVIRFVAAADGRGDGVSGLDLAVKQPDAILELRKDGFVACGTRIRLCERSLG